MSYHQHYEFLAIDRPLRADELAGARAISSHATVTSTRFAVSYDWGDLRGDPDHMLLQWYDAHLYRSSNYARLAIKLPAKVLDAPTWDAFAAGELQSFETHGEHIIVSWRMDGDGEGGWIDDNDVAAELDGLVGVRAALLRGDLRPLYVGWLAGIHDLDDQDLEPPVPPGMGAAGDPSPALAFFLGVEDGLLAAAAEASVRVDARREIEDVSAWLATVPSDEKDAALASWLGCVDHKAQDALRLRFAAWRRTRAEDKRPASRRTVANLRARAAILSAEGAKAEVERKARERAAYLEDVAARSAAIWAEVERLSQDRRSSAPQQVIDRLLDLRAAADSKGLRRAFDLRLAAFAGTISPTRALHKRLKWAGLVA